MWMTRPAAAAWFLRGRPRGFFAGASSMTLLSGEGKSLGVGLSRSEGTSDRRSDSSSLTRLAANMVSAGCALRFDVC
ncbi:hypothetical protein ATCV1_z246R [Acanthocystis turfacea chlorella virus 1]|uniref:Uncharacterized protein z246R n=1 Tax=Chlorovirus heliozoae TaxID=322019 RepID=A7K8K6_9PHYC|nr:hypothetical protein ATCV1_z246R [Acanthocystis turfacea chlorella virus 1]ABT16380.1 hypothetical protein ATCV1_z246R [Acanthocystis turfacea chlorella virus 1]